MKKKLKIAILLDVSRAYERDILKGITNYNNLHEKFVFFLAAPNYVHEENEERLIERILAWKPDGILTGEGAGLKSLLALPIPIIILPHTKLYPNHINVWGEGHELGEMVAEHFISKGYKNFAFLGYKEFQWSQERQEGYVSVAGTAGYAVNTFIFDPANLLWEQLPARLRKWLATIQRPCAVFSATDELNIHLLEAAKASGVKVPDDISIMGVDNDVLICEMTSPTLSSVAHNAVQAGFQAALALSRWMEHGEKPAGNIVVHTGTIITRSSTNALAIDDENVRNALHYISNTAPTEDISVDEVVKATTLSRRVLEKRFQLTVKNSILDEIRKKRIERIKYLLVHSELPVKEIALELNFRNIDNITRYFKENTGLKPLEYRNKFKRL